MHKSGHRMPDTSEQTVTKPSVANTRPIPRSAACAEEQEFFASFSNKKCFLPTFATASRRKRGSEEEPGGKGATYSLSILCNGCPRGTENGGVRRVPHPCLLIKLKDSRGEILLLAGTQSAWPALVSVYSISPNATRPLCKSSAEPGSPAPAPATGENADVSL